MSYSVKNKLFDLRGQKNKLVKFTLIIVFCILYLISIDSAEGEGFRNEKKNSQHSITSKQFQGKVSSNNPQVNNREASLAGFKTVYSVLMHPRCMNCHPSGDIPLQGEASVLHTMRVQRGKDGRGISALKCSNCHQAENIPGLHTPPGNPNWHLPPSDMKMPFQGKTPRELALQLLDPSRNGGKSKEALIEHVTNDKLVQGGWNPSEGRSAPPVTHLAFVKAMRAWLEGGAYIPRK